MKRWQWILIVVVAVFLLMQLYRPIKPNPPYDPTRRVPAPQNIQATLNRACNDCHSNRTSWPWYAQIAPVSWWLASHVADGRKELNFDEWSTYSAKRRGRKLDEICEQVNKGEMPLKSYLPLHPNAKLSEADRNAICDWANAMKRK